MDRDLNRRVDGALLVVTLSTAALVACLSIALTLN